MSDYRTSDQQKDVGAPRDLDDCTIQKNHQRRHDGSPKNHRHTVGVPATMYRESHHMSNTKVKGKWHNHTHIKSVVPSKVFLQKNRRVRKLKIVSLQVIAWKSENGPLDAHWSYLLTVQRGQTRHRYVCRYSSLRTLVDELTGTDTNADSCRFASVPAFPRSHWLGMIGKQWDTLDTATDRGKEMLASLRALLEIDRLATEKSIRLLQQAVTGM